MKYITCIFFSFCFLFLACNQEENTPIIYSNGTINTTDGDAECYTIHIIIQQYDDYSSLDILDYTFTTSELMSPNCSNFYWFVTSYMSANFRIHCRFDYCGRPPVNCQADVAIYEKPDDTSPIVFLDDIIYDQNQSYVDRYYDGVNLIANGHWYFARLCVFPYVPERE